MQKNSIFLLLLILILISMLVVVSVISSNLLRREAMRLNETMENLSVAVENATLCGNAVSELISEVRNQKDDVGRYDIIYTQKVEELEKTSMDLGETTKKLTTCTMNANDLRIQVMNDAVNISTLMNIVRIRDIQIDDLGVKVRGLERQLLKCNVTG